MFHKSRFHFLLLCLLLLIVLSPLLEPFMRLRLLLDIFLTAVLISGVFAVSRKRWMVRLAILFAVPLFTILWLGHTVEGPYLELPGNILGFVFSAVLVYAILDYLFSVQVVNMEVISGSVVGYLLLGLLFAFLYATIETIYPGSFPLPEAAGRDTRNQLYYFSFVTLTTLGFGDITPMTAPARSITFLEAVIGQLYLTILIARIVGMHISQGLTSHRD